MIQRPTTRAQLFAAPALGVAMGLLTLLFHWSWAGADLAAALAIGVGLTLTLAWAHAAWCSPFGARQWLAGAACVGLCLAVVASGVGAVAGLLGDTATLAPRVAASGWATVLVATGVSAWREHRALARAGASGPWWRQTVDAPRGTVADCFDVPSAPWRRDAPWLLLPIGVNLPLALQGLGVRQAAWLPFLLAGVSLATIWVCWSWLGPAVGRAWAVMNAEAREGRRHVHRDLAALQALRRGETVPTSTGRRGRPRERDITAPPAPGWQRAARVVLELVAGVCLVGGATLAVVKAWPALDRALRWDDYRPAEVVVEWVDVGTPRAHWLGGGRVDGREVRFGTGELDAVLGAPPTMKSDARLVAARARLPLVAQARWNPQAQQRLLALDASRPKVDGEARFAVGVSAALLGIGVLGLWARRALSRRLAR